MPNIIQTWNWLVANKLRQITQLIVCAIDLEIVIFTVEIAFQYSRRNTYNSVNLRQ